MYSIHKKGNQILLYNNKTFEAYLILNIESIDRVEYQIDIYKDKQIETVKTSSIYIDDLTFSCFKK